MIEGKAIARFGSGDILVTPLVKKGSSNGCLVLQNQSAHMIGEYERNFGQDWNDTVLSFDNTESLDVVIERLEKLRDMMNGDRSDCYAEIDYNF